MLESHFNKVACHQPCNFISKGLQHSCFPVKLAKFLRTPILKNNCFYSEKFTNFREKHLSRILFLIRLQGWRPAHLLKTNSPAQVFSCEICEIFKNTARWLLLEFFSEQHNSETKELCSKCMWNVNRHARIEIIFVNKHRLFELN